MGDDVKTLTREQEETAFTILATINHRTRIMLASTVRSYTVLDFEEDCKRLQSDVDQLWGIIEGVSS